jgi:hypothetical protein
MAIKGKGRTKTRQPVRAPRRGPVPVPVPFLRRRGVQALAAFLAGLLVFWGGVWLTNGLRAQDRTARAEEQDLLRRRAGASWKSLIETEVGTIGTVQEGSPPVVLPEVRTTLTELGERTPTDAVGALQDAAAGAKEVSGAIESYDLSSSLTGKGFDKGQVLRFLSARDELLMSLTLIREGALLGVAAARLDVADRAGVLDRAQSLLAQSDAAMARFQTHHVEALSGAGINPQQPALPGLPGS